MDLNLRSKSDLSDFVLSNDDATLLFQLPAFYGIFTGFKTAIAYCFDSFPVIRFLENRDRYLDLEKRNIPCAAKVAFFSF